MSFTFAPGAVLEGDIYLIAGDYKAARQVVYDLNKSMSTSDIFTPFGSMDIPTAGSQVNGSVDVAGWAFDNVAVSKVEVFVDNALAGAANYGLARPDVSGDYPNAPVNVGFEYTLDTTRFVNGAHTLGVKVADTSGNVAVFPPVTLNVNN